MAFMGLMVVGVILMILGFLTLTGIILMILGIVLRLKKHKKASKVLFIAAAGMLGIVILVVTLSVMPRPSTVDTPTGEAVIMPSWIEEYQECLETQDMDGLRKLVARHPDMIYYYDANYVMLLDYGLYNCDIEIMQIALDSGAVFDEPLRYDHMIFYTSLDSFFSDLDYPDWEKAPEELVKKGETTERMLDAVAFAIDHGAAVKWNVNNDYQNDNFFDEALLWVNADEVISSRDEELLQLIAASDLQMQERYDAWKSGK